MPSLFLLASGFTEIRPGLIFWTLVTFAVVFLVLRSRAWGPILSLVQEREKSIINAIESAKRERAEAEKLLAEQKSAVAEARREAAEMLRKNQAEMEAFRTELMAKSRREAEEFKEQARREIDSERTKAVAQVRAMAVDLSLEIAKKLIGSQMDDSKQKALAEQFVSQLPQKPVAGSRAA